MTLVKTKSQIKSMTEAGRILAIILRKLSSASKPGVTTKELNSLAGELCRQLHVKPAFLGYNGYPATLCASLNSVVVHGIPGDTPLKNGDILGLDMGVIYNGYCSDAAVTVAIGDVSPQAKMIIKATKEALEKGIDVVRNGARVGDIGYAVSEVAKKYNLSVVRELTGHGIGKQLQEDPSIPNYGKKNTGPLLKTGMTICIEPMFTTGSEKVKVDDDNWTIRTVDSGISAHFEHMILVTPTGSQILTK